MAKGKKKKIEEDELVISETVTMTENTQTITESIIVEEIQPEAKITETANVNIRNKRTGR